MSALADRLVNRRACFAYDHRYRVVDVKRVWQSKAGDTLITGIDPGKGEYRSFRADRVKGKIRIIRQRRR